MKGIREFFASPAGTIVAGVLILIGIVSIVVSLKSSFGESAIASRNNSRIMVCSETGKTFTVDLAPDMTFPVKSPYSGKNTGYPYDETCNWTADGQVSSETTYLLRNKTLGKKGPTFCPVCHRLVVKDNPVAQAGHKPPPTEAEYDAKRDGRVEEAAEK